MEYENGIIYLGHNNGVAKYEEGNLSNFGLNGKRVTALLLDSSFLIAGTEARDITEKSTVYYYDFQNKDWYFSSNGFGVSFLSVSSQLRARDILFFNGNYHIAFSGNSIKYLGYDHTGGYLYRTKDIDSPYWKETKKGYDPPLIPYFDFMDLEKNTDNLFACAIPYNTNNIDGSIWKYSLGNWDVLHDPSINVISLCWHDGTLFAGTDNGNIVYSDNLISWQKNRNGLPLNCQIVCLDNNEKHNIIFAGTNNSGVFCSSNNGLNWQRVGKEIQNYAYIEELHVVDDTVFACTDNGFFKYVYKLPGEEKYNLTVHTKDNSGTAIPSTDLYIKESNGNTDTYKTNGSGSWSGLYPSGIYEISGSKECYEFTLISLNFQTDTTIVLIGEEQMYSISGYLEDTEGNVLKDMNIEINSITKKTDINGYFSFDNIYPGSYNVNIYGPNSCSLDTLLVLGCEDINGIVYKVPCSNNSISLKVNTKTDTGGSLNGVLVTLKSNETSNSYSETSESGNVNFEIPAGSYDVYGLKECYEFEPVSLNLQTDTTIVLFGEEQVYSISGIVQDQNENILSGMAVEILSTQQKDITTKDGSFIIGDLKKGIYDIRIEGNFCTRLDTTLTLECEDLQNIQFTVSCPEKISKLDIITLNTVKAPIGSVSIEVYDENNSKVSDEQTNGDGECSLNLNPGEYTISASKECYEFKDNKIILENYYKLEIIGTLKNINLSAYLSFNINTLNINDTLKVKANIESSCDLDLSSNCYYILRFDNNELYYLDDLQMQEDGIARVIAQEEAKFLVLIGDEDIAEISLDYIIFENDTISISKDYTLHINICDAGGEKRLVKYNRIKSNIKEIIPNPAHQKVVLKLRNKPENDFDIVLSNSFGGHVEINDYIIGGSSKEIMLDISQFSNGIYNILLLENGKISSEKLVIIR